MDFFARQERVRTSTHILVALFALAVIAIVVAVDMLVALMFGWHWTVDPIGYRHRLIGFSTLSVLVLICGCALFRIRTLSEGGSAVAVGVGGVLVPPEVDDAALKQLRNVVEEVAIASGTPVPDIYVMPQEAGINAFAAGYSPSDAAICVTQGCLDHLTRDELQGVIAHEFSHVLNGDMRLNIRLMGLLFGIMALSVIGRQFAWFDPDETWSESDRQLSNKAFGWIAGVLLITIGSIGYFFGRLIQSAVARERESLADACAVQFTRQTAGLAGALKKIAVIPDGSQLRVANCHEVAHMMFGEVDAFNAWFATHPPLVQRIRTLEPWFREQELEKLSKVLNLQADEHVDEAPPKEEKKELPPLEWPGNVVVAAPAIVGVAVVSASAVAPTQSDNFHHASAIRQSIPASLIRAARQPEPALALSLALAMSEHADLRQSQQRLIADAFGDDVLAAVDTLVADEQTLAPAQRMPLVGLALPALKQLSAERLQTLRETLEAIVSVDPRVDLDEYCLVRLLRMYLREAAKPNSTRTEGQKKLPACRDSVALVCAVVAVYGSNDEASARRAWQAAMNEAFPGGMFDWRTLPLEWQAQFDRALDDLDGLLPVAKEIVIQSLLSAIRADGTVTATEKELLRVVCASLHCPVPQQP